MLKTSAEQQQIDQMVVASTMTDYLALQPAEEWTQRYHVAAERVSALYEEFVPEVDPRASMFGSILGAGVMAFVEMRYGPDEHTPKQYSGSYETDVLALQHNAAHPWRVMRNMFRYAVLKNAQMGLDDEGEPYYDADFFLRVPIIAASHDVIMGNQRRNDERQSALFAGRLMVMAGGTLTPDERSMAAIESTTWDDEHHRQLRYDGQDFPRYRIAAQVADLLCSHEVFGVYEGIHDITENLTKRRHERILTLEALRRGFDLVSASMEERMEFVDSSDELRRRMNVAVSNQSNFFRNLSFVDPSLASEFPGGRDNALFMDYTGDEYKRGALSSVQLLQAAKTYAGVA